ncbi:MAG: DUF3078 domain-containing protein [Bacteroidales bacterium]|nr:DUF3078 domain-containing protein [Bacteroidales bacterium]
MRRRTITILFLFICLAGRVGVIAQGETKTGHALVIMEDTSAVEQGAARHIKGARVSVPAGTGDINLDKGASLNYLQAIYSSTAIWKKSNDPLREAIGILIYNAIRPPLDSTTHFLLNYGYDGIRIPLENYYLFDSVRIIVPLLPPDSLITDTLSGWNKNGEMFIVAGKRLEKVMLTPEAKPIVHNDTLALNDSVYILMKEFVPTVLPRHTNDTIILVITDTLPEPTLHTKDFPFRYLKYPMMSDSIEVAIRSLIGYLEMRDSTLLQLVNETGKATDVWLNSRSGNLMRFWLPDGDNDSITVWIGSPARRTLSLKAEEGVSFKKQSWHDRYIDPKVNVITATEEDLRKVTLSKIKPNYWRSRGDMSYLLSQGAVSNWAKGGENNISTVLDVTGYLDYNNKVSKVSSSTTGRFALGMMASGKNGIRKNLDLIEINSKVSHKAFGKFDLIGIFQFKTQLLPGYNYPNDSVKVSKFLNPATFILGYGLDYKPNKNLSINCSPITYKGIFVPDTAMINQTKYGVPADRRSKNEMGAYVTINSTTRIFDKVNVTNRVQFFSNFISKPQNIDIDWEVIMITSLNWFTDLRLNAHLIYDDNTLLPVYDKEDNPVLDSNGVQKKSPRVQFKELLGVSFVFRF